MRLAIILSLISVVVMFTAIEFIVNYNRQPYTYEQKADTETKSNQISFGKKEHIDSDIQITRLSK